MHLQLETAPCLATRAAPPRAPQASFRSPVRPTLPVPMVRSLSGQVRRRAPPALDEEIGLRQPISRGRVRALLRRAIGPGKGALDLRFSGPGLALPLGPG